MVINYAQKHTKNASKFISSRLRSAFSGKSDLNVVFVVGAPRSGTTLMQSFLSAHSQFTSPDIETGFFRPSVQWEKLDEIVDDFSRSNPKNEIGSSVRAFEHFVNRFAKDGERFVEKTPQHILCIRFLLSAFPNSRIIHMVRDPRDAYASAKKHPTMPQKTARQYYRYWKKCVKHADIALANPQVMDVRYEDFVSNVENSGDAIMKFLCSHFEMSQQYFWQLADRRKDETHFAKLGKSIDSSSVGQFRVELSDAEARLAKCMLPTYMKKYHYL